MIKYSTILLLLSFTFSTLTNLRLLEASRFDYKIKSLAFSESLVHHVDVGRKIFVHLDCGNYQKAEKSQNEVITLVNVITSGNICGVELKANAAGNEDFVIETKKQGRTVIHFKVGQNEENDTYTLTQPSTTNFISLTVNQVLCLKFTFIASQKAEVIFSTRGPNRNTEYVLPITEMGKKDSEMISSTKHCFYFNKAKEYGIVYESQDGLKGSHIFRVVEEEPENSGIESDLDWLNDLVNRK